MTTSSILFGNDNAHNIDIKTKQTVIDILYNTVDLYNYRYNLLNTINKLKYLKYNEHYVSPNFKGFNYLLMLLRINNNELCIAIDKKTLSYSKSQIDITTVIMFRIDILTNHSLYDKTIFDGKLIKNENKDSLPRKISTIFLIHDCYYLMGKSLLDLDLITKLSMLNDIYENNFKNITLNFHIKLNRLYRYIELANLISNMPLKSNGLIFYPKKSGITIIYIDKKIDTKVVILNNNTKSLEIIQNPSNIIYNYTDLLKSKKYSYEDNTDMKILSLIKTHIPDVYNVFDNDNKLGIASIPSLKISHMCDELIQTEPVKFHCTYCNKFKKWIPIKIV